MDDVGFLEKSDSRENEGNSEETEENKEETAVISTQQQHASVNLDLNLQPTELYFGFPEKQTENILNSTPIVFGVDLKRMERHPDDEIFTSSSKKMKFSAEEGERTFLGLNIGLDKNDILHDMELMGINKGKGVSCSSSDSSLQEENPNHSGIDTNLMNRIECHMEEIEERSRREREIEIEERSRREREIEIEERSRREREIEIDYEERYRRYQSEMFYETAQRFAKSHELDLSKSSSTKNDALKDVVIDDDDKELGTPFGVAMKMIKTPSSRKKLSSDGLGAEFQWVRQNDKRSAREVPSLLDISLRCLAKHSEAIVSLNYVPDMQRHTLSRLVSDSSKMDARFLKLLASGSPTEIRINDCSQIMEKQFTEIFGCCDTKNLIVLQLDLCGSCLADHALQATLARSSKSLPALVTLSLNGAYRLSDQGLNALALSAPSLQSINLSHCSFLTSSGIKDLANCFESTLRELYLDECPDIDAMVVLPALKKLKCLEVLSMAGNLTVCDDFVIGMVEACGKNIKELVFAHCVELTDISLKIVGENCSKLCAIDLSYLRKLTDLSMRYLANGCPSIKRLKLSCTGFSDEAIAAFLEASGSALTELSLNNIALVGVHTALSLSKCSRKLSSLDLSWCRKLTDEALGLIVDSCSSLKQLKLFGCTQITDVFLKGHSNPHVQIIGQEGKTGSKLLDINEPQIQEAPLRYFSLSMVSADK